MDIVTEVLAAGLLSIMAGIIALMNGAYIVGAIILGTSIFVTTLWMVLFFLSSKRIFQLPKVISILVQKLGKEKGKNISYIKQILGWKKFV